MLGFLDYNLLLGLQLDHIYTAWYFYGSIALLAASLMACTYSTQWPTAKVRAAADSAGSCCSSISRGLCYGYQRICHHPLPLLPSVPLDRLLSAGALPPAPKPYRSTAHPRSYPTLAFRMSAKPWPQSPIRSSYRMASCMPSRDSRAVWGPLGFT